MAHVEARRASLQRELDPRRLERVDPQARSRREVDARSVGQRDRLLGDALDEGADGERPGAAPAREDAADDDRTPGGHRRQRRHLPSQPPAPRDPLLGPGPLPRDPRVGDLRLGGPRRPSRRHGPLLGSARGPAGSSARSACAIRRFTVASDVPVIRATSSSCIPSTLCRTSGTRRSAGSRWIAP